MKVETSFIVPASGIGRKDYTVTVERSTAALYSPSLKQEVFIMEYWGALATLPFPSIYLFAIPMPQEDGTWGWEASSITMHFMEMSFTIGSNNLTLIGLLRFASLDDYYAFIIAENFPQMYGYSNTKINYTLGIPTQPGSVYIVIGGFWSTSVAEQVSMVTNGLITDLTREWMMT
jgi:hypothetical protein